MKSPLEIITTYPRVSCIIGIGIGLASGFTIGRHPGSGVGLGPDAQTHPTGNRTPRNDRSALGEEAISTLERRGRGAGISREESKDFAQSVRSIFRENIRQRRIDQFEKLVARTGIEHLPQLVSLIRENDLRGNNSGDEWSVLWTNWGERDPQAAMDFFKNYDWTGWNDSARGEAQNRTLTNWAQTDPETARRFVEADPGFVSGDRSMVYGMVEGWANVDPAAAADWLFKNGLAMGAEYDKIVAAFSRSGGHEALDTWFSKLDSGTVPDKDRSGFARAIAHTKLQYEPDKAAAWVESNLDQPWMAESEIVGTTARAFAERDPKAAVEWANRNGLDQATSIALATWCQRDVGAAGQWVKGNVDSPGFAQSASLVMVHLQHTDPAAARAWAEGISDAALRERLLAQ